MGTARIEYQGNLRTKSTHLKSGQSIYTDAPVDNNGKGSTFSPTDLVATAYVSCMITIMGIYCDKNGINFKKCIADVTKEMASGPRRVHRLIIEFDLTGNDWTIEQQNTIIKVGEACPVAMSVSDGMEVVINYTF